ncbi:MAG: S1 family peptidase, partial [Bacteroidales bacterium]|nr:S1 family peptidase [Bacteroidales bacterium]
MKNIYLSITALLFFSIFNFSVKAQISQGGTPISFEKNNLLDNKIPKEIMPIFDINKLLLEDSIEEYAGGFPWRFGKDIDVNYDLENSGLWETLENGDRIWRLNIISVGAYSINLIYNDFNIPAKSKFFIYSEDKSHILGAFTEANNKENRVFASFLVKGESCILEYYEPANVAGQGVINISKVIHGYKDVFGLLNSKAFGSSGSCNVNINCPEGNNWQTEKKGVAMILLANNTRWCSGSLVNNTDEDGTPYFLTAEHCGGSESTWIFMFKYESSTCPYPGTDGPTSYTVQNSTKRAENSASDFLLVEISTTPPQSFDPYYIGWNRQNVASSSSTAIHHPSGDVKKISFEYDPVVSDRYLGTSGVSNSHWKVIDWDVGTTEGGSSGSALFDPNHRIVGQLHGGYAACGNNLADWYGKFSMSWDYGSSSSSRLRDWLDPTNTGAITLDGYDPYATPPSCTTPVSPTNGQTGVSLSGSLNWNSVADATGYKLYFGSDGGGITDPTNLVNGTDLGNVLTYDYTSHGLSYNTIYYWKIIPYNTNGDATGCPIWNFTTESDPYIQTIPFIEDWETGTIRPLWTTDIPFGGVLEITTMDNHTPAGQYSLHSTGTDNLGRTCSITADFVPYTSKTHVRLNFWYNMRAVGLINLYADVYENSTSSWHVAYNHSEVSIFPNWTDWTEVSLNLSDNYDLSAGYKIRFRLQTNYTSAVENILLDDIEVSEVTLPGFWTGMTNTDWSTDSNWDDGTVPYNIDVTIPSSPPGGNFPETNSWANAFVSNLLIEAGAKLTVPAGKPLIIMNDL